MSLVIPTRALAKYNFDIALEGRLYRMQIMWNSRHEFWTLNISDNQGNQILRGIKLVINYELIRRYKKEALPPGALIPIDVTEKLERIGRNDLGTNVQLVYIPEEEFNELIQ